MMASSSDVSNADHHLLPQSSSLPFPHANIGLGGGQWSHPALMHLEQLSSDELEALLHSAHYYQQQQLVPHGQLSSSLLMMQDQLGFQWTSCCSAALTTTSQEQDALLKEEEEEDRMMMTTTSAPATIIDAYRDVNVSLLSASDDGGGDEFEMSSSSPARLCRSHDVSKVLSNSSSAVLVHNGVRLREQYEGGGPPRAEALSSIVHSYSCKMGGSASASDSVSENNPRDEQQMQMQMQAATSTQTKLDTIVPSFKVRKEKLGDRIAALQQLVSPFGKTDTASVLMEAIGYIKFLQDQVETLSGPYMQSRNKKPRTSTHQQQRASPAASASNAAGDSKQQVQMAVDLRSRGLCLVPLSCTSYVTNENAAAALCPPPYFRD